MDKRLESRCNNHVKEWLVMVKSDEFLLIITRNGFFKWLILVNSGRYDQQNSGTSPGWDNGDNGNNHHAMPGI